MTVFELKVFDANGVQKASGVNSISFAATPTGVFDASAVNTAGAYALSLSMDNQNANTVFAGPTSGGGTTPAFRALVGDDIPSFDASKITTGQLLLERGGTEADMSATGPGHLVQVTSGAVLSVIKDNFAGTAAPTTTDDGAAGYAIGSYWYDTTNDKAYVCLDATNSAAVWRLISNLLTTKGDILTYSTLPLRLAVGGVDGQVLTVDSASAAGLKYAAPTIKTAIVRDEQTSGTAGGNSTATTWTTRVINTEHYDPDGIVTISSNKFTPIAGKFRCRGIAPFAANGSSSTLARLRIRNVTAAAVIVVGSSFLMPAAGAGQAEVTGFFTANGTDEYDLQYYVSTAKTTNGLGSPMSEASVNEIYAQVELDLIGA